MKIEIVKDEGENRIAVLYNDALLHQGEGLVVPEKVWLDILGNKIGAKIVVRTVVANPPPVVEWVLKKPKKVAKPGRYNEVQKAEPVREEGGWEDEEVPPLQEDDASQEGVEVSGVRGEVLDADS